MSKHKEHMWRYQQQFLVHSYLYYVLNESLISDHQYDWVCKRLYEMTNEYPMVSKELPYHDICSGLDASGSGYYIQEYPEKIRATALRLLWLKKKEEGLLEDFPRFISRWGFTIKE